MGDIDASKLVSMYQLLLDRKSLDASILQSSKLGYLIT